MTWYWTLRVAVELDQLESRIGIDEWCMKRGAGYSGTYDADTSLRLHPDVGSFNLAPDIPLQSIPAILCIDVLEVRCT